MEVCKHIYPYAWFCILRYPVGSCQVSTVHSSRLCQGSRNSEEQNYHVSNQSSVDAGPLDGGRLLALQVIMLHVIEKLSSRAFVRDSAMRHTFSAMSIGINTVRAAGHNHMISAVDLASSKSQYIHSLLPSSKE